MSQTGFPSVFGAILVAVAIVVVVDALVNGYR